MTKPVRRKSWLPILPMALAAAGCGDRSLEDEPARDPTPPELTITSPNRGLVQTGSSVTVTGSVRDFETGVKSVVVNGTEASVGSDGRFEVDVSVANGITLLQTTATDEGGNETVDTRAVLSGELAPHDQDVREAMAAHLSSETFAVMADISASIVNNANLGQLAQAANPVYRNDGCLGAEIDVETIEKSGVDIELTPTGGGLNASLTLRDLNVVMDTDYEVACIGGSAGLYLTADKFTISGMLSIELVDGALEIDLVNTTAAFEGFELDVGVIPSSVVSFFVDDIDDIIAGLIRDQAEEMLPTLASDFFSSLAESAAEIPVFGRTLSFTMKPTLADFTPNGGTIALDSNIQIKDVFGPGYVSTPASMPSAGALSGSGQSFRLAVADDAFNQVLASMHASGMLEQSFELEGDGSGISNFADRIDLHLLLPPVVRADIEGGIVEVVIGDLLIDIVDLSEEGESIVTRAAISGRLQLQVTVENGAIKLVTMAPELWVDLVDDGVSGANPLAYADVEKLASIGSARIASVIDDMLSGLPLPVFAGTTIGSSTFEPAAGYVVVGGELLAAP